MAKTHPPRFPISKPGYTDRLEVEDESGKLFWDGKEIVTHHTIDLTGFDIWWKVILGIIAVCTGIGGVGGALDGLVNLNKEVCWVEIGTCNGGAQVAPTPTVPVLPSAH
jgi:hypothetical protein